MTLDLSVQLQTRSIAAEGFGSGMGAKRQALGGSSPRGEDLHEQVADGDACKALDGAEGPNRLPCELPGPKNATLTATRGGTEP